jgi:L-seryl-tRNA(Ser) seleniumtransferase
LVLAALQATVDSYLQGEPARAIPILGMLQATQEELQHRAEKIVNALQDLPVQAGIGQGKSQIGGGTLPRSLLPSVTVDLVPAHGSLAELGTRLRLGAPPVVGYIGVKRFKLDLRTVFASQDEELVRRLRNALSIPPHT